MTSADLPHIGVNPLENLNTASHLIAGSTHEAFTTTCLETINKIIKTSLKVILKINKC